MSIDSGMFVVFLNCPLLFFSVHMEITQGFSWLKTAITEYIIFRAYHQRFFFKVFGWKPCVIFYKHIFLFFCEKV